MEPRTHDEIVRHLLTVHLLLLRRCRDALRVRCSCRFSWPARPRPNAAPWGFPSGHVLSLVVYFGVVAFLLVSLTERRRPFRFVACFACGAVVGLVAVSRIYLDMHWLSDVIGGLSLGAAYLLIAIWLSLRLGGARPGAVGVEPVEVVAPPA